MMMLLEAKVIITRLKRLRRLFTVMICAYLKNFQHHFKIVICVAIFTFSKVSQKLVFAIGTVAVIMLVVFELNSLNN